jgi:hypothetical protein
MMQDTASPPAVTIEEPTPVRRIDSEKMKQLGMNLSNVFTQYMADRRVAELKWLRNMRQYLGIYDSEIEAEIVASKRSAAYPKLTRVKCISVLSRVMNLMFPGNEDNWSLTASPSPEMSPQEVMGAIQEMQQKDAAAGAQVQLTDELVQTAVFNLATKRAKQLSALIKDQLTEIGGDQTLDYIALNRAVVRSGIMYGMGVLRGPFVRKQTRTQWGVGTGNVPAPVTREEHKPMFEFLPIWDFYPDMSAKTLQQMDGYFVRMVLSRAQLRALANRNDFFQDVIKTYIVGNVAGNYKAQTYETDLRSMGVKINVSETQMNTVSGKYELLVWHGPISAQFLQAAGIDIEDAKLSDDIDAEVWLLDGQVIKADMNPWSAMGADVRTIHTFLFDEDDTSPVGNGLPNVMRDSQMSLCATTRMLLDNASVTCGPNLEVNTDLLRADQDITSISPYKIWYRDGYGADANVPAVRNITIDGHIPELLQTVQLFMQFADMETFVGPATGGDMERGKGVSEPMRTIGGASMLRADAALPFKDIVRSFDMFTQSVINSLVHFNRAFNPGKAPAGDYNVIARGATSLIAKEMRGIQIDQLASTLSDGERVHVDERKMVEMRFSVRDLEDMLVTPDEAARKQAAAAAKMEEEKQMQQQMFTAELRKMATEAFKNVTQGNKNAAAADAQVTSSAIDLLERGIEDAVGTEAQAA